MTETSERVTVRIPQELMEKLRRIQLAAGTGTISDTIREGLERYVEMHLPPSNVRKVVVELSRQDNSRLEELVRDGASISVDDAVRWAVRDYIRQRIESAQASRAHRTAAAEAVPAAGDPAGDAGRR
ncbi:MAG: ribbon-helix-helix domain-containing protein [Thermoplasmata archaeon]